MSNKIYDTSPVIDPNGADPVTVAEAKTQLRITFADDDTEIANLIKSAIGSIEHYTNTKIRLTTLNILADLSCELELPCGPHIAITGVSVQNGGGTYDALTVNTDYTVDIIGTPAATGSLAFARFRPYRSGRMKIVCTAGYGDQIPPDLKAAVLNEVAFRYANKGDGAQVYAQQTIGICQAARVLANPFRRLQWI